MNNNHCNYYEAKSLEDVFGAYLLDEAQFDGYYDIPFVDSDKDIRLPSKLVSYSKITSEECDDFHTVISIRKIIYLMVETGYGIHLFRIPSLEDDSIWIRWIGYMQ